MIRTRLFAYSGILAAVPGLMGQIAGCPPDPGYGSFTIVTPTDGQNIAGGYELHVRGRYNSENEPARLMLYGVYDPDGLEVPIEPSGAGRGQAVNFEVRTSLPEPADPDGQPLPDGTYQIRVQLEGPVWILAEETVDVVIDRAPRLSVSIDAPSDGDTVSGFAAVQLDGDVGSGPADVTLELVGRYMQGLQVSSFPVTVPLELFGIPAGPVTLQATIVDQTGATDQHSIPLTVDSS